MNKGYNLAHCAAGRGQTKVLDWLHQKDLGRMLLEKIKGRSVVDIVPEDKKAMLRRYIENIQSTIGEGNALTMFGRVESNGASNSGSGKKRKGGAAHEGAQNKRVKKGSKHH